MNSSSDETISHAADFTERVSRTQHQLGSELDPHYDFIVCRAGSSGSWWARGDKNDWDFFASEGGGNAWSYESVLKIYRPIEDWHGAPDPNYRGTGGPVYVQPAPDPNPVAAAALEGARSVGIPTFENQNGRMMEGQGGASITDVRARDGYRQSVFRSYVFPYLDKPNLTVLTGALVTRLTFDHNLATGGEVAHDGKMQRVAADPKGGCHSARSTPR